eukprot:TRINITY_DN16046_c0_g1_i7.p1 TRINITY_DN16046_c0_g1~~TRINITY_DN16046_c0_g1_i7.p1  ORF type:complete len:170 (+),score=31.53 TRINITY_DN16046_c0_g1_i7:109-618(+)
MDNGPRLISGRGHQRRQLPKTVRTALEPHLGNTKCSTSSFEAAAKISAELYSNSPKENSPKKIKKNISTLTINFNESRQSFDKRIYSIAKRKVQEMLKEVDSSSISDSKLEELLLNEIQEVHESVIAERYYAAISDRSNEYEIEICGLKEMIEKYQMKLSEEEGIRKTR